MAKYISLTVANTLSPAAVLPEQAGTLVLLKLKLRLRYKVGSVLKTATRGLLEIRNKDTIILTRFSQMSKCRKQLLCLGLQNHNLLAPHKKNYWRRHQRLWIIK